MADNLRAAIQRMLDEHGDGWSLSHFVVVMGLERLDSENCLESTAWLYLPGGQPDYVVDGLLSAAERLREGAETE